MVLEITGSVANQIGIVQTPFVASKSQNNINNNLIFIRRPDGKVIAMTKEEFIKWVNSKRNNPTKPESKQEPYELGPQRGGKRVIDIDNVSEPTKAGSSAPKDNACPPEKLQEYKDNIENANGRIDDFRQGKRGDCYLLSSIQSIRQTKDGQDIILKM